MAITEQPHTHSGNSFLLFKGTPAEHCVACTTGQKPDVHPLDAALDKLRDTLVHTGAIAAETINTVLADPQERASYLYFEARHALDELLDADPRGWEDVLILLRRTAHDRKAFIVEAALEDARRPLDVAARYEDTAGHIEVTVTDPAR